MPFGSSDPASNSGPVVVGRISDATGSLATGLAVTVAGMGLASVLALAAGRVVRRDT